MEEEVVGLKEKVSDFAASSKVHEERCINYDITTTNKLNTMNEKVYTLPLWDLVIYLSQVLEVRQLVGVDALSKGLASFKLINEMKRNATIDESGFMLAQNEQVWVRILIISHNIDKSSGLTYSYQQQI